jgi:hypothetical protein
VKVIAWVAATVIGVCLAALAWVMLAPRQVPPGQSPLTTIAPDSLPGLKDAFNAADGKVRLLVLLSPT